MEKQKKILLINAHLTYLNWTQGTLNKAFQKKTRDFFISNQYEVLETIIEFGYNPKEEVQKHLESDIIILQMPLNWFGAPWIYKRYIDEVFSWGLISKSFTEIESKKNIDNLYNFEDGENLNRKKFMISATLNLTCDSFNNPKNIVLQGKSASDLLLNITTPYRFCGYEIVQEYLCCNISKRDDLIDELNNYPNHLIKEFAI